MSPRRIGVLVLAFATTLSLPSCLFGSSKQTRYTGTYVSEQLINDAKPGDDKASILRLFGEPTKRTQAPDSEIWEWQYTKKTEERGALFLIFATENVVDKEGSVLVEFKDGLATRVWRTGTQS